MTRATASAEPVAGKPDARLYKLLAAGLGLALLGLGAQQTCDAALRAYAEAGVDPQRVLTQQDVETLRSRGSLLDFTDAWFGDPEARIRAGFFELRAARGTAADPRLDAAGLHKAIDDLTEGLRRAPADMWGWANLGEARLAAGDKGGAAAALTVSLLLGPYEQGIALYRCGLGLQLWPDLDANGRRTVAQQLRLGFQREPEALVTLAKSSGRSLPVMIALAQDAPRLTQFIRALAARR